jgi:hypothetical protein
MMKYNANLKEQQDIRPHEAGKGTIQLPSEIENIAWQTRGEAPSAYEAALTDALEEMFGAGIESLPDIVAGLNDRKVLAPDGSPWTEASFQSEIKRLGAPFA